MWFQNEGRKARKIGERRGALDRERSSSFIALGTNSGQKQQRMKVLERLDTS
jgi:hypothetical protein